jgi:hypothetical protein
MAAQVEHMFSVGNLRRNLDRRKKDHELRRPSPNEHGGVGRLSVDIGIRKVTSKFYTLDVASDVS